MHIAYSRLNNTGPPTKEQLTRQQQFALKMAVKQYKKACRDYAGRIAAIQKRNPGWFPKFNFNP
ncbi:hypothetical protein HQ865_01350 [Mucilaginibacter mali]|uniref:Uncharacterized protein n=1 Tax=Mucilaginibacter mali TaxID=2740462 RepID=A0A7D4UKJ6_9SPHI|nr:hypothetical protein [Mucilaginibacter mali]QKJ28461.1 hypothetical protein HQ865_01350 [Mucilaginibacter mali]